MARRALAALTVGAMLGLAMPSAAQGATFCVQKPKCVKAGGTAQPTIGDAIAAAAANGDGLDRIELGPRTYADGPWSAGAGNPVRIVGAGAEKTTLRRAAPGDFQAVLAIYDPRSSVERVRVVMGQGSSVSGIAVYGRATRVRVSGNSADLSRKGVSLGPQAVLERSRITVGGHDLTTGVEAVIHGALVRDTVIEAPQGFSGGSFSGSTTRIVRSRITATSVGVVSSGGDVVLDNALVVALNGADGVRLESRSTNANLTVRQSTVVARKVAGVGVTAIARIPENLFCSHASIVVRNTIIHGFADALERRTETQPCGGGESHIDVAWSALRRGDVEEEGAGSLSFGPGVTGANPRFVAAKKGNFRLRANSKLIDRGQPGKLGPGESKVDLDGRKRVLNGDGKRGARRDIGAYEFKPKKAKKR